jgi:hypothetical protein
MTDRELLESAAKSIGWVVHYLSPDGFPWAGPAGMPHPVRWNPLVCDGDAFRLAVKLKMQINVSRALVAVVYYTQAGANGFSELFLDDPAATTRRAIVVAAAEIGKEIP